MSNQVVPVVDEFESKVRHERVRQSAQWGGPTHDDTHLPSHWKQYIEHQLEKEFGTVEEYLRNLVNVAALAKAAYESTQRKVNAVIGR
jgi:hypothetical protein